MVCIATHSSASAKLSWSIVAISESTKPKPPEDIYFVCITSSIIIVFNQIWYTDLNCSIPIKMKGVTELPNIYTILLFLCTFRQFSLLLFYVCHSFIVVRHTTYVRQSQSLSRTTAPHWLARPMPLMAVAVAGWLLRWYCQHILKYTCKIVELKHSTLKEIYKKKISMNQNEVGQSIW